MQLTIKSNSYKVINFVANQTDKLKKGDTNEYIYFDTLKDFLEHLFQSIPIIAP